jgi:Flp pilus assembly protein TadD
MAEIHLRQWRWAEAEQEFRRAISLNPNYPTAHHWFSIYQRVKGQFDEALKESKRAQDLDPLSLIIGSNLAQGYFLKNDINSAREHLHKLIELDPSFPNAHHFLGWLYHKEGHSEEAAAEFEKAVELSGRASGYLSSLGYGYAVTGRRGEAIQILRELEGRYAKREALGIHLAGVCAGLDEMDRAFAWLEKDYEQRSGVLPEVRWWNNFGELRSDPRYANLLRRMGLEP